MWVLYRKENVAESGMTSFLCIGVDFCVSEPGWAGVVSGQRCHLTCNKQGQKHPEHHAKCAHARAWSRCNLCTLV